MISTIHSRTHQVHGTGIHTDILLVGMLFMNDLSYQMTIRSHHITSQFGIDCYISHSCRYQHFFVNLADTFTDRFDVVRLLIRTIRNTDTAGQVDKCNMCTGLLFQLHSHFKKCLSQCRIIFIGHSVTCKECMNTEILHTFCFQNLKSLEQLLCGKTIFCIAGVVHNIITDREISARIVSAA